MRKLDISKQFSDFVLWAAFIFAVLLAFLGTATYLYIRSSEVNHKDEVVKQAVARHHCNYVNGEVLCFSVEAEKTLRTTLGAEKPIR